ncbi:GroES-like protein [Ramaria rubella]|nr:GroES-like protein [Ramaria rubella]
MKAIAISALGGVDVLQSVTTAVPSLGPCDVLVRVCAISINPVETKIRNGTWAGGKVIPGTISGFDFAGVVEDLGPSVPPYAFSRGDEVYGLGSTVPTHSNAEYVAVDWQVLARKPVNANWEEAAAIPLVGLTAWEMLVEQLEIRKGQGALLVINGAGGVGSIALQIAREHLGLQTIIATASRPETVNHAVSLGATHTISHHSPLQAQIDALSLKEPVKYVAILTTATRDIIDQAIDIITPGGKIGLAVQGVPEAYAGIGKGQLKSVSFHWSEMILKQDLASQGHILRKLAELYEEDKLRPIVTQCLELTVEGLRNAHTIMEQGKSFGKVVLGVPERSAFE